MESHKVEKKSRIVQRSVAYPAISLEEAVASVGKLRQAIGKGPYSREAMAEGLGYKNLNGAAVRKVAALAHFGLLSRKGNVYIQTILVEHIINAITEEEKSLALIEAVRTPTLYASLIKEHGNRALPSMLDKIMIRQGISDKVAKGVADDFKKSLEFSRILKGGVLVVEGEVASTEENGISVQNQETVTPVGMVKIDHVQKTPLPVNLGMQGFHLPSGIVINYPANLGYLFAIGKFGVQIAALEEAVNKETKPVENENDGNSSLASE